MPSNQGDDARSHGRLEVVTPSRLALVPGVEMVGFRQGWAQPFDEVIPPGPTAAIVLDCGSATLHHGGASPGGLASGLAPTGARVSGVGIDCIELRLSPLDVAGTFDVAPTDLSRSLVRLDDLWGRDAEVLVSRLRETSDWERRFSLAAEAFAARFRPRFRAHDEVVDAWRRITASGGQVSVSGLAGDYGWSRGRFWNRFTAQIGVSPKHAARIVRFDRALQRVGAGVDLATVAAECGYYDQSHLNREFRDLASITPGVVRGDPLWS